MMLAESMVSFTSESLAGVLQYPTEIFTDLKFYVALIIGLPLGFWVIRKVISLVRARG